MLHALARRFLGIRKKAAIRRIVTAIWAISLAAMPALTAPARAQEAPLPATAVPPVPPVQAPSVPPAARPPDQRGPTAPGEVRVAPATVGVPVPIMPLPEERPPPGHTRVLTVPVTAIRPTLDGALDDAAWKKAVTADRFWISEQRRWPREQTEVLVMADREYLYFGFRVYDSRPESTYAVQTVRGAGLGFDDYISVELDTFLSHREISSYSVNAKGVQDDAIGGGRARQLAWKGDWQAAVARTSFGWSAEIAIPFSILNFEAGRSTIGVNFLRYHNRTSELSRWADVTVRSLPEEMGRLAGLQFPEKDTQPWAFMPYVLLGRNAPDKRGNVRETLLNTGTEIRYQPRANLTGVISINPDYSQIETAITSINFNYNEKFRADGRPFFQEGSSYFGDQRGYFYSNRIPDFDYGAKFFTRMSGYQVGALATRSPDDRTDFVVRAEREFDATHSIGAMLVATDRRDLTNALYVLRGQGREGSGLNYSLDAAMTSSDRQPSNGSRLAGSVGWGRDFWSLGVAADRYALNYNPANALLDRDLPDTTGIAPYVSYYRDFGDQPLREIRGDLSYTQRWTSDDRVQRRNLYTGGSIETKQQVRIGFWYSEGVYRPVGATAGSWSATLNHDHYWTGAIDFNTRSSRFGFGGALSSGSLGGGDYEYTSMHAWARPTVTTFVNVTAERLSNFVQIDQTIISAGWDISPRHSIVGRFVRADYGMPIRVAYSWHARKNVDLFLVYDRVPDQPAQLSGKIVMTIQ